MKKIAVIIAVLLPIATVAAYGVMAKNYILPDGKIAKENTYIIAGDATIGGKINEDLSLAAGGVLITGEVLGDAALLAGEASTYGNIKGDARMFVGHAVVGGNIGGDLAVGGGRIVILPKAKIGGEAIIGAGEAIMDGEVEKGVSFKGGSLAINGVINGPVYFQGERLIVGDEAEISGDLHFNADAEVLISNSATIIGERKISEAIKIPFYWRSMPALFVGLASAAFLIKFVGLLIAGLLFSGLFKKFTSAFVAENFNRFGKNLLWGAAAAILLPIVAVILVISLFGALAGFFLLAAAVLLAMLACFMSIIFLGSLILKTLSKGGEIVVDWRAVCVGVLAHLFLWFVPVAGKIILVVVSLASTGALLRLFYQNIWLKRK